MHGLRIQLGGFLLLVAELLELAGRLLLQGGAELLDVRVDAAAEVDHLQGERRRRSEEWARIAQELRGVCGAPAAGSPASRRPASARGAPSRRTSSRAAAAARRGPRAG